MSQIKRIKAYLESGRVLTRLIADDLLGSKESPARISELRAKGYPIKTKMVTVKNRYGEKIRVAEWSL
jgi:hypothetical protein